jgi:ketosteroid isomerase-like protein
MPTRGWTIAALLLLLIIGTAVRAEDMRPAMEAVDAQWLAAFNMPDTEAFVSLYTADAAVYFQGSMPVTGPESIRQFREERIKPGIQDHTFDIVETAANGEHAWHVSRTGEWPCEKALIAGYTLRICEKQSDGTWKTKGHKWNRPQQERQVEQSERHRPRADAKPGSAFHHQ